MSRRPQCYRQVQPIHVRHVRSVPGGVVKLLKARELVCACNTVTVKMALCAFILTKSCVTKTFLSRNRACSISHVTMKNGRRKAHGHFDFRTNHGEVV